MTNPSGRKGAAWEMEVVRFLRDNGFPEAERRVKNGRFDRGDVTGVPGIVIECKAERVIDLPGYLRETEAERVHADAAFGFTFVKNRRHSTADGYAVLSIDSAVNIIRILAGRTP
jgi:Holliday junction resolvase